MSVKEKIKEKVGNLPFGKLVPAKAFRALGSRDAIDQALSRLVRDGELSRPVRGFYMRSKRNRFVGEVPPDSFHIAKSIAEESGFSVQVHGAEALRRLGLSNQVPMKPVFLTDGPSRRVRFGAQEVLLKHVSPRKVALSERPAGLALTALWYLGKENVTPEILTHIRRKIGETEFEALRSEVSAIPEWLFEVISQCEFVESND